MTSSVSPTLIETAAPTATAEAPFVRTAIDGAVFRIELNRSDARNPLSAEMVTALSKAVDRAEQMDDVRVILFTAAGKAFSAGGDLGNITDRLAVKPGADGRDPIAVGNRRYGEFLSRLAQSPKVTVACVNGAAMGGGAGLVCAVDIAVGSPAARFGFPEAGIGLVPGQILPFVSARVGDQVARRLMLTGERINGVEAHRIGLLDYLAQSEEALPVRVQEVLEFVVATAPAASVATKSLLAQARPLSAQPHEALKNYLDAASVKFAQQMRSEAVEGVTAARERRPARWNVGAGLPPLAAN
ncbi:enoyl-CoA hydratase/isomerase family protein [Cupriavidus oxalaticus]|jgi:isohexenylglutaconyl-CoA hydratase|uniref:Enoyl-CoA hydratase n=1 Tax=Cupriavidus oxalaticus TaxID=96344 RepID=A0A375G0A9_9BURK|nr:enoyl-CoA hydratase/isomerase family protein [Cupriavidus oxalaticus]QRQ87050.1 enoyl-CoA hydratase/isomerase family protein [Cupriavidus oxalaticus]QRQ94622.1 enoyl-CoA hydratase/isomerase family protein [Cupriavidus oxalaticus]WQD83269.1 enoyl-CoA hydratase/isomerase family protein [Cupriavidus oxalaticus]SPC14103.1 Enoyl-CoA hydratase [Cupriavidus oxalaticus]